VKLLVFAHKPPPHHGQSYMVQLFLETMAQCESGQEPIQVYHVDSRFSTGVDDIGRMRLGKFFLVLKYCFQALRLRFRHGITHFYYVPADLNRSAIYRDWIVMALCRPFFKKIIFHWHASGLGGWVENTAKPWERWVSRRLLGQPDICIVLSEFSRADAEKFRPKRIVVVPNGIPDPCPEFDAEVLPLRKERIASRRAVIFKKERRAENGEAGGHIAKVLYLSLCHRPKGLFDAIEAVAINNQKAPGGMRVELTVAGAFWSEDEKREFEERLKQPDLCKDGKPLVHYVGFVSGAQKKKLFLESDLFCFPTYYPAESFGLVLLEAMAYGLPIVSTFWRMIPEVMPSNYPGLVPPKNPEAISRVLASQLEADYDERLRERFCHSYTPDIFGARMKTALLDETNQK
jgi:glycosyltransferase involved in cell wall biosynthesis